MPNQERLRETKHHGAVRFPFNIYPCTIPGDFLQVPLHWHDSMELVYVKKGSGIVQVGVNAYPDRKSTRLNSSHASKSRMPSSA